MRDWLRRVFHRSSVTPQTDAAPKAAERQPWLDAWIAAMDAGLLRPPADVHDASAWDEYWTNQLNVGAPEQGLSDAMSSDSRLPLVLASRGAQTILCVGNGLSWEAWSLALHGFEVTGLDISAIPRAHFLSVARDEQHAVRRVPGFVLDEDGTVTFTLAGAIDPRLCPAIHQGEGHPPRGGGRLRFAQGDLTDLAVCPGPFDVIVERRTLQLFPKAERLLALDRLVERLSPRGVLVSHEHQGGWRPGMSRTHHGESALVSKGFVVAAGDAAADREAARLAYLMFSTG
jgi:hypothetical protein